MPEIFGTRAPSSKSLAFDIAPCQNLRSHIFICGKPASNGAIRADAAILKPKLNCKAVQAEVGRGVASKGRFALTRPEPRSVEHGPEYRRYPDAVWYAT